MSNWNSTGADKTSSFSQGGGFRREASNGENQGTTGASPMMGQAAGAGGGNSGFFHTPSPQAHQQQQQGFSRYPNNYAQHGGSSNSIFGSSGTGFGGGSVSSSNTGSSSVFSPGGVSTNSSEPQQGAMGSGGLGKPQQTTTTTSSGFGGFSSVRTNQPSMSPNNTTSGPPPTSCLPAPTTAGHGWGVRQQTQASPKYHRDVHNPVDLAGGGSPMHAAGSAALFGTRASSSEGGFASMRAPSLGSASNSNNRSGGGGGGGGQPFRASANASPFDETVRTPTTINTTQPFGSNNSLGSSANLSGSANLFRASFTTPPDDTRATSQHQFSQPGSASGGIFGGVLHPPNSFTNNLAEEDDGDDGDDDENFIKSGEASCFSMIPTDGGNNTGAGGAGANSQGSIRGVVTTSFPRSPNRNFADGFERSRSRGGMAGAGGTSFSRTGSRMDLFEGGDADMRNNFGGSDNQVQGDEFDGLLTGHTPCTPVLSPVSYQSTTLDLRNRVCTTTVVRSSANSTPTTTIAKAGGDGLQPAGSTSRPGGFNHRSFPSFPSISPHLSSGSPNKGTSAFAVFNARHSSASGGCGGGGSDSRQQHTPVLMSATLSNTDAGPPPSGLPHQKSQQGVGGGAEEAPQQQQQHHQQQHTLIMSQPPPSTSSGTMLTGPQLQHRHLPEGVTMSKAKCSMVGRRSKQEDSYTLLDLRPSSEDQTINRNSGRSPIATTFLGVYDGHGGDKASLYASNAVHEHFLEAPEYDSDVGSALVGSLRHADASLKASNLLKSNHSMGTTAVCAVLRGRELTVANLGDSRAVLCVNSKAVTLTVDHKPSSNSETTRIRNAGGTVEYDRVSGDLDVSRGMGDYHLKHADVSNHLGCSISNVADVTRAEWTDDTDYVLLATDGLWDVISPDHAVKYINDHIIAAMAADPPSQQQHGCGSGGGGVIEMDDGNDDYRGGSGSGEYIAEVEFRAEDFDDDDEEDDDEEEEGYDDDEYDDDDGEGDAAPLQSPFFAAAQGPTQFSQFSGGDNGAQHGGQHHERHADDDEDATPMLPNPTTSWGGHRQPNANNQSQSQPQQCGWDTPPPQDQQRNCGYPLATANPRESTPPNQGSNSVWLSHLDQQQNQEQQQSYLQRRQDSNTSNFASRRLRGSPPPPPLDMPSVLQVAGGDSGDRQPSGSSHLCDPNMFTPPPSTGLSCAQRADAEATAAQRRGSEQQPGGRRGGNANNGQRPPTQYLQAAVTSLVHHAIYTLNSNDNTTVVAMGVV